MDTTVPSRTAIDQSLVARIVSGYVRKNQISPAEMPTLINTVYQSLLALGMPPEPEAQAPAVSIRRSSVTSSKEAPRAHPEIQPQALRFLNGGKRASPEPATRE
jgi:hypothetical protein